MIPMYSYIHSPGHHTRTRAAFACRRVCVLRAAGVVQSFGIPLLDALCKDWYYPLLFVMFIPTTLVAIYLNWFAMKFFRHASRIRRPDTIS